MSIRSKDALSELVSYQEFKKLSKEDRIDRLYKAVHVGVRLLLEVRSNQVKMSKGEKLVNKKESKIKNGIKGLDQIKIKEDK